MLFFFSVTESPMSPFNNNTSKLIAILIPAVSLFIISVIIDLLLLICPIVVKQKQRKKKKLEVEKINQSLGTLISQTSSQSNSKQGSPLEKEEDTHHPEYTYQMKATPHKSTVTTTITTTSTNTHSIKYTRREQYI